MTQNKRLPHLLSTEPLSCFSCDCVPLPHQTYALIAMPELCPDETLAASPKFILSPWLNDVDLHSKIAAEGTEAEVFADRDVLKIGVQNNQSLFVGLSEIAFPRAIGPAQSRRHITILHAGIRTTQRICAWHNVDS